MKNKAQAGLEYLMTYGWALVIIVTVIGVLFLVIGSPTNKFTCKSTDPTKIVLQSYSDFSWSTNYYNENSPCSYNDPNDCWFGMWGYSGSGDPESKIVLINATGGAITLKQYMYGAEDNFTIQQGACVSNKWFAPDILNGNSPWTDPNDPATWVTVPSGNKIEFSSVELSLSVFPDTYANCGKTKFALSSTHTFGYKYTNQFGQTKDFNVVCTGYPAAPISLPI